MLEIKPTGKRMQAALFCWPKLPKWIMSNCSFARMIATGLKALIAIHNTLRAQLFLGGTRCGPTLPEEGQLQMLLRLSRGMTFKKCTCWT